MRRRAIAVVVVLVLLAGGAGAAWFLHTYERVSEDVRLPPKGEAAINPLYALRATLRAHGEAAESQRWFRPAAWRPGAGDTLVMYGQAAPFTAAEVARLLAWVRGGGHLVLRSGSLVASPTLAQALGLTVEGEEFGCARVQAEAAPKAKDAPPPRPRGLFDAGASPLTLCGATVHGAANVVAGRAPDGGHRFARVALGKGTVSLLPDLDFLHNRGLEAPGARELAYQVLAPGLGRGRFLLVYGDAMPSLLRLLLTHGWPVLLPATLALFAWLALRAQRFGTLRPVPATPRRALLEHVQAAGEFAWRRGRVGVLHAALRGRFERRLARRDPLLASLEGEARVLALAERCALPAARVRQALAPTDLQRPDVFLHSVSTLALMRLRL